MHSSIFSAGLFLLFTAAASAGARSGDSGLYYSFSGMMWEQKLSITDPASTTHELLTRSVGGGISLGRWLPWMGSWEAGAEFGTFFGKSSISPKVSDQEISSYRPTGVGIFGMRADIGARYEMVPGSLYFAVTVPVIVDFSSWPVAPTGYTVLTDMSMVLGVTLKPEIRFESFFLRPEAGFFNFSSVNYFALSFGQSI